MIISSFSSTYVYFIKVEAELQAEAPGDEAAGEDLPIEVLEAEEALNHTRWMEAITEDSEVDVVNLLAADTELLDPVTTAPMTVRLAQRAINNFTVANFHELHKDINIVSDADNLILPNFEHVEFDDRVGGRVSLAWRNWRLITDSEWVLDVVRFGYKLEFAEYPPMSSQPVYEELGLPPLQTQAVHDQVLELVDQGAIAEVLNPFYPQIL